MLQHPAENGSTPPQHSVTITRPAPRKMGGLWHCFNHSTALAYIMVISSQIMLQHSAIVTIMLWISHGLLVLFAFA